MDGERKRMGENSGERRGEHEKAMKAWLERGISNLTPTFLIKHGWDGRA